MKDLEQKSKTPLAFLISQLELKKNELNPVGNKTERTIRGTYSDAIVMAKNLLEQERAFAENNHAMGATFAYGRKSATRADRLENFNECFNECYQQ